MMLIDQQYLLDKANVMSREVDKSNINLKQVIDQNAMFSDFLNINEEAGIVIHEFWLRLANENVDI